MHEKHIHVDTSPAGKVIIFTAASYKKMTGKEPADDGLRAENMTMPDGKEQTVYKVS